MGKNNQRKAKAIYTWTMKRYIPISIAYWVLLFLTLPMEEVFVMTTTALVPGGKIEDYLKLITQPQFFLILTMLTMVIFSTVLSFIALSFMHNKRCVDFFGSLPVGRRTMFFSRYLSVITLVVIPLLIDGIIGGVLTLTSEGFLNLMGDMLLIILAAVGNVTMIAFISLCSGTISDVVLSYLALNISYPICIAICSLFPKSVVPGVSYGLVPVNVFSLFAPVVAPFTGVFANGTWIFIVWWIVFTVVLILGCFKLCKKRKAETAQNTFTFSVLSNVVKFITCFAAGFGFGWVLSFFGVNMQSVTAQYIWFFFGLTTGVVVSDILLHLIFQKGMEYYAKSLILCAVVIICAGGFLFFVTTGMFGYDSYIPKAEDVKSVYCGNAERKFEIDGVDVLRHYSDNQSNIENVLKTHQEIVDKKVKKNGLYPIVADTTSESPEDYINEEIIISYQMKNGHRVERIYPWTVEGKLKIDNSDIGLWENVNMLYSIPYKYAIPRIAVYNYTDDEKGGYEELSEENLKRLLDALKKDYEKNGIIKTIKMKKYKYEPKELEDSPFDVVQTDSKATVYKIVVDYSKDDYKNYVYMEWYVDESYTNTFAVMKELKLLNTDLISLNGWISDDKSYRIKGTKTFYFEIPKEWSDDINVQAVPVSRGWDEIFCDLRSESTKCEKISKNIWKYEMPVVKDMDGIMFYQVLDESVNYTGGIEYPQDDGKNFLKLTQKRKRKISSEDFPNSLYNFEWTSYEEENQ